MRPFVDICLDFGVLKPGFGCIIKLKLISILAPNIYTIAVQGVGGGTVSVDTKGEGVGGGIPLPCFSCIKMLKFT